MLTVSVRSDHALSLAALIAVAKDFLSSFQAFSCHWLAVRRQVSVSSSGKSSSLLDIRCVVCLFRCSTSVPGTYWHLAGVSGRNDRQPRLSSEPVDLHPRRLSGWAYGPSASDLEPGRGCPC